MNTLHILCLLISLYCIVCTEYVINLKEKVNFATIQKNSIPLESLSFEERGNVVYKALRSVAENSQRKVKHILTSLGIPFQSFWISNTIIVKDIDENILELLHQCDDIESIEKVDPISLPPNEISTITENPELMWNIEFISSQKAYEKGYYGQNVVVGVIDSGVTTEHEDLIDKYRGSKDGSHDYNWFDTTSTCEDTPCDDHGHGSHVTGTILGSNAEFQVGVAPNATFIACKGFLSNGKASIGMLLGCLQWMLAPTTTNGTNPDPNKRPHIVNNSWGGGVRHTFYDETIDALHAAGVTLVFAAGNYGPYCQSIIWPGGHSDVITVGALGYKTLQIAFFSSLGSVKNETYIKPDVVAPGALIISCSNETSKYAIMDGTSMATPAVTGAIALLWNIRPDLMGNHAKTKEYLISHLAQPIESTGCSSTSSYPNNIYGYGMVNLTRIGHFCFGKQKNDPQVCSQKGMCIDTDLCNCTIGWVGNECQFPVCFGKSANDAQVCSGRGNCTNVDKCECLEPYTGQECESSASKFVISFFVLFFVLILNL